MLTLLNNSTEKDLSFEPQFFRIDNPEERDALELLLKNKPYIRVHDELDSQLEELIKSKYPKKKPEPEQLNALKILHLGDSTMQDYGVWVYYPWTERLVHLLDEEEFVNMRTNRNVYKITPEERDLLGKQIVGVVGLSVGQSVSVTMAMERGFGEIRLADFDILELTNLNRIRTGVQSLGLPKVIIVAREIKEIDPFLKVTCFGDGLTEENMDRFFTEGGNLNVIVDECDGLDIKILLRHKAKAMGIPVVMDASDRGTVDVERFDLEPDRPILHGLIEHLDHTQVKHLKTNEEKVPFLLAIIGIDTLSSRLKASMVEVGQTITTWPQLASAVALGGALCADICRRIILDQYHESGRYWVDIEELIGDKVPKKDSEYDVVEYTADELTQQEMLDAVNGINQNEPTLLLNEEQVEQLVSTALLAPSAGNNQPWKWVANAGRLYLFHDEKFSVSWGDFDNITSNIAFGTAIENLKIEAGRLGMEVQYRAFPNPDNHRLIAAFTFKLSNSAPYGQELAPGLAIRLTNRKKGNKQPINMDVLQSITKAATNHSQASIQIIEDEATIDAIAEIVAGVERVRFLYPQGHHDFYTKEVRWTDEAVQESNDGLDIRSLELSESDRIGLLVAANPEVIKLLNKWGGGSAFEKLSRNGIKSSSAIGLISMPSYSPENFIAGGEAVQRVWLQANLAGLSFHPISAPLFLFARLNHGNGEQLTPIAVEELSKFQDDFFKIFPNLNEVEGIFMFRLSYADEASVRSLRKPLAETLQFI